MITRAPVLLLLTLAGSPAAVWRTGDGLAFRLSDSTGRVEAVDVDGAALPLAGGGGVSFREYTRDPTAPARVVLRLGAEGDQQTWSQASFADWSAAGDYVRRRTGGAAEGEAYLELGDGRNAGVGMAAAENMPLPPGGDCTISWMGRAHRPGLTYILCLRLFDRHGQDITGGTQAPAGWAYSPHSNAHYRLDVSQAAADTWERFACAYLVHEHVASGRVSLRVYRDGGLRADIDDLQVAVKAGHWTDEVTVDGPVERTPEGLRQRAEAAAAGLAFETRYLAEDGQLRAEVEVTDRRPASRGRCLQVRYRLPLALTGWTWSADPGRDEVIEDAGARDHSFDLAGHRVSRYPLVSVSRAGVGVAMAVPLDQPALQSFRAEADGLSTVVDLALSPLAPRARGRFSFSLYRHDPAWRFRAALERYYALFPALFAPATGRGGAWTLRMPKPELTAPEDFGLAFYECGTLTQPVREYCRAHGVLTFPYAEPWGRRQNLGQAKSSADLPPYEERLAELQRLAERDSEGSTWSGAPRQETARAVLNSAIHGADGVAAFLVDYYVGWSQWWQLNTDPDLPEPSIASLCRKYEIEPVLEWADGIYLDSISPWFFRFEDHRPEHLASADLPLAFSLRSGAPVVLSGFAQLEFVTRLRDDLHRRGKLLMMNLFPPGTRLFGHLGDVVGSEVLGLQEDEEAIQQRVYAYRRPVSNLMQWRSAVRVRVPAMTPEEIEAHLANQLLYGFWPGMSTAGGGTEPGYAHMHRYFEDGDLLARDRPLFRRYLPLFNALNQAGWEPVTQVRSDQPAIRLERFGRGPKVLLTVANTTAEAKTATLTYDRDWWRAATGTTGAIAFHAEPTGETHRAEPVGAELSCRLALPAHRTLVLRVAGG